MKCNYAENNKIKNETFRFNLLPENIDRRSGRLANSEFGERRINRLSAANGVWAVGWYIPRYLEESKLDELSEHILRNKQHVAPEILAIAMYCLAKNKKYPIFDVDIIAPVPNHEDDPYKNCKAVSIAKYFTEILKKNGNDNARFQRDLFYKYKNITTKTMTPSEKESYYKENRIYQIDDYGDSISGLKILLIDDVITQGFTAEQCLNQLTEFEPSKVYFYAAGTTKIKG